MPVCEIPAPISIVRLKVINGIFLGNQARRLHKTKLQNRMSPKIIPNVCSRIFGAHLKFAKEGLKLGKL